MERQRWEEDVFVHGLPKRGAAFLPARQYKGPRPRTLMAPVDGVWRRADMGHGALSCFGERGPEQGFRCKVPNHLDRLVLQGCGLEQGPKQQGFGVQGTKLIRHQPPAPVRQRSRERAFARARQRRQHQGQAITFNRARMQQQEVVQSLRQEPVAAPFKQRQGAVGVKGLKGFLAVAAHHHLRAQPTPGAAGAHDLQMCVGPGALWCEGEV